MLRYLFDTDHLTLFQHGHAPVARRLTMQPPNAVGISIVTIEESLRGRLAQLARAGDGPARIKHDRDRVQLWEVSTGSLLHALRGHKGMVRSVAFTPDGRTLASGGGRSDKTGEDRTIRLWDVATTRCTRELEGHSDTVRSLAFAPDGRTLATSSNDRTVRLWDTETGRLLRIERSPDKLVALAFAPDGATLAVATNVGVVTIHDATSLAVLKSIRHATSEEFLNLAFAPDGRSVATCGMSGTIRLWDALTGQELLSLQGHKAQINGIAFAPDGSSLASCSHDGEVKLWRAQVNAASIASTLTGIRSVDKNLEFRGRLTQLGLVRRRLLPWTFHHQFCLEKIMSRLQP